MVGRPPPQPAGRPTLRPAPPALVWGRPPHPEPQQSSRARGASLTPPASHCRFLPPLPPDTNMAAGGDALPIAPRGLTGRGFKRRPAGRGVGVVMAMESVDGAVRTLPSIRRLSRGLPFGRAHGRVGLSPSTRLLPPAPRSQVGLG